MDKETIIIIAIGFFCGLPIFLSVLYLIISLVKLIISEFRDPYDTYDTYDTYDNF